MRYYVWSLWSCFFKVFFFTVCGMNFTFSFVFKYGYVWVEDVLSFVFLLLFLCFRCFYTPRAAEWFCEEWKYCNMLTVVLILTKYSCVFQYITFSVLNPQLFLFRNECFMHGFSIHSPEACCDCKPHCWWLHNRIKSTISNGLRWPIIFWVW